MTCVLHHIERRAVRLTKTIARVSILGAPCAKFRLSSFPVMLTYPQPSERRTGVGCCKLLDESQHVATCRQYPSSCLALHLPVR